MSDSQPVRRRFRLPRLSRQPRNYKDYVGPQERYGVEGRRRFETMLRHGLTEDQRVLDIGCGSLRLGRLLIPFLLPGRYHGLEPGERWVREGLQHEVRDVFGAALVEHKRPVFRHDTDFDLAAFGTSFDFVVAFGVFIHCGREQLERCLREAASVLQPGARMLLDVNVGERSEERGRHPKYPWSSHQSTRYARADVEDLLHGAGFSAEVAEEQVNPRKRKTRVLFELRQR